jgi:hypothetical protein
MPIELAEHDFAPRSALQFQHWGERDGPPFHDLRPLSPGAAERVWRRTASMAAATWTGGAGGLDLRAADDWTRDSVRDWLLSQVADRDEQVLACYQPTVAIALPWGTLCDHWLTFLWTGGCVWPASEAWVLVHDGDQFVFGRSG